MTEIGITKDTSTSGTVAFTVTGEVDVATAPLLRERLIELFLDGGPGEHLLIDLSGITFLDSTGLGVLVGAHKRCVAGGARMTVVATGMPRRVMQLTGLDRLWELVEPGAS